MKTRIKSLAFCIILFSALISCSENKMTEEYLILLPAGGEIIYTGTSYTVYWNPPSWTTVDINLINASGDTWLIEKSLPNSGSFFWHIPPEIPETMGYSIVITNSRDPGAGIIGGSFEIRSPGERSSFTDSRDGQTYKTVKIGTQWWMAENFNFPCEGSHYYKDSESNGLIYGMLYTLEAAEEYSPPGWHLPSDDEWKQLESFLGMTEDEIESFGERGSYAGFLLGKDGGPGFDALYGGYHNDCVGKDAHKNWESHFWTSTKDYDGKPLIRVVTHTAGGVSRFGTICHGGSAVRYIKDAVAN